MNNSEKQSREVSELHLLFEISTKLSENLDLKTVLRPILRMTAEHMGIIRGTLTILNRKKGEIVIEESYGLRPEEEAKGKYRMGEGITGQVIDTGQPAIVPRISDEPLFLDRTGSRKHVDKGDIAFICVPIKAGTETIGAISADRPSGEKAALEEDVRLLTIIGSCISQAVRLRQLAEEEIEKIREENQRLQDELKDRFRPKAIVGNSKVMRHVYFLIEKVCRANTTVLILGESGVGKERVAHAIHYNSPRAERPFIKVNCAALPESLTESELFGHERGAFTGATNARKGRFEMAQGGTIFLDEIGDLPASVQTKLLRVLQEKEFERIGGTNTIRVDVRIIAATNRELEKLMGEGRFREDLYYRLNVFPVVVPPLRERKTDIMLLADHFVERYSKEHGKHIGRISTRATDMLMSYHWPGNVRELENCIERAIILSSDGVIHGHLLPPNLQEDDETGVRTGGAYKATMTNVEKEMVVEELKRSRGNMAKGARALEITERMMGIRVAKYGIDPRRFKQTEKRDL
jgi:Nif-specific regulatory protein